MPRTLVSVKMDSNRVSQEPNSSERLPAGKKKMKKKKKRPYFPNWGTHSKARNHPSRLGLTGVSGKRRGNLPKLGRT